jgi:hypothetical protein
MPATIAFRIRPVDFLSTPVGGQRVFRWLSDRTRNSHTAVLPTLPSEKFDNGIGFLIQNEGFTANPKLRKIKIFTIGSEGRRMFREKRTASHNTHHATQ